MFDKLSSFVIENSNCRIVERKKIFVFLLSIYCLYLILILYESWFSVTSDYVAEIDSLT